MPLKWTETSSFDAYYLDEQCFLATEGQGR